MALPKMKKVTFRGVQYWVEDKEGCEGPLAPLSHFNEDGTALNSPVAFAELSYAWIKENGQIVRYQEVIGHRDELKEE